MTGFVLGTNANVNGSGASFYWVALKGAPGEMVVGSYVGDDTDNRNITTVGFQPDYVWVLPQEAYGPVQRTLTMVGDIAYDFDLTSAANRIQALNATGFQVGSDTHVNSSSGSKLYHYVAWKNTTGRIQAGSYTGSGVNGQVFDILGFTPEWVVIKRDESGVGYAVQKPWSVGPYADYSLFFNNQVGTIHEMEQLRPVGFMAGFDGPGDDTNESGVLYHYVAMGLHVAPTCCDLTTTQAGTSVTVETSEAKMVWDASGEGGGLNQFYAKNESSPTQNRAGDDATYNLISTQIDDATPGWHFEDSGSGTLSLLEATSTRVRVRQQYNYTPSLHLSRDWTVHGFPRLAFREDITLDSTQTIRGAQGIHAVGPAGCPGGLYCAGRPNPSPVSPVPAAAVFLVTDDAVGASDMLDIPYTTPFFGRVAASGQFQAALEDNDGLGAPNTYYSRVWEGATTSTTAGTNTRHYLFYPLLAGLT